jgi:hypothetical protein
MANAVKTLNHLSAFGVFDTHLTFIYLRIFSILNMDEFQTSHSANTIGAE